jgi:hypothetical protein
MPFTRTGPRVIALLAAVVASAALAQQPPAGAADDDDDDLATPMPMPVAPAAPPTGVRKLSDAGLSCEQIYAEATQLEKSIPERRAEADALQREANASQQAMMKSASSGMMPSVGASLLGMIPGAGMVSSLAQQAAASAQMSAMQEGTAKMMASYQRMAQVQEQLAYAQARNDHLVGMFLAKGCKLPEGPKPVS